MMPVRQEYRRNFLTKVIARIDFDTPLAIKGDGPGEAFLDSLRDRFPVPETQTVVAEEFAIGSESPKHKRTESIEYVYHGIHRDKKLILGEKHMLIEYNSYSNFGEFSQDFLVPLGSVFQTFTKRNGVRLGLRYVNTIEPNDGQSPTDWSSYLVPSMYGILDLADDRATVSRAFHLLELNYGDSFMRVQFGLHNPDHPATVRKKQYILDFDVYCQSILAPSEIENKLSQFHDRVNSSFEELIRDPLRELMGPVGNA